MRATAGHPRPRSPVPRELLDEAPTLTGALEELVRRFPDFACLTVLGRDGDERHLTLAGLATRARAVQTMLVRRGTQPGDVVLLVLPTGPELLAAYFGALFAGAVPGLLATPSHRVADPAVYAARIGAVAENAAARLLYCDAELAADLAAARLPVAAIATPADASATATTPSHLASAEDVATVQYSSGSTGTPKGVLLTHRAMLANLRAVRDGLGLEPADTSVNWIPLYHDMGLIDAFLLPLLAGCPTVLVPTMDFMREPSLWLHAITRYRGAISWAPNFAYTLCAKRVPDADLAGIDLSTWRIAINAAEPVLAGTIAAFAERFAAWGFRAEAMTPAWGLAENVTIATAHPVGERPRIETLDRAVLATSEVAQPTDGPGLASVAVGRCLPGCRVEIRDRTGRALPERRVGTVWLRSDSLFEGYHRDPAATARVLVRGWLDTGDRGYLVDGHLHFLAREKDLIVIGGEKYAPHDVETAINRVPGVREGCTVAFGVLDPERGTEDVAAVLETRVADQPERDALVGAVRTAVMDATGLALRHVLLVPPGGVEKTTSGKLARRATRARWATSLGIDP